jgi:hypothetical protein
VVHSEMLVDRRCSEMKAVAIRKGQANEQAAGFQEMGTFRCEGCGEEFFIGHHPEFADQGLAERQARWLEKFLRKSTNATRNTPTESNCPTDSTNHGS